LQGWLCSLIAPSVLMLHPCVHLPTSMSSNRNSSPSFPISSIKTSPSKASPGMNTKPGRAKVNTCVLRRMSSSLITIIEHYPLSHPFPRRTAPFEATQPLDTALLRETIAAQDTAFQLSSVGCQKRATKPALLASQVDSRIQKVIRSGEDKSTLLEEQRARRDGRRRAVKDGGYREAWRGIPVRRHGCWQMNAGMEHEH